MKVWSIMKSWYNIIQGDNSDGGVKHYEELVQGYNSDGGVEHHEELVEEQVHQEGFEKTAGGETRVQNTKQIFHQRVIETMYTAASTEQEQKTTEKCMECCCETFSCDISIKKLKEKFCCQRSTDDDNAVSAVKKIKEMSPILRRGRSKGWVIHTEMIFPLVKASCRNIWVFAELMAVVVSFILSMVSFSLGNNRIFTLLHMILTIVGTILAIIDGVILLRGCCVFTVCKHRRETSGEAAPAETSEKNKCCKECLEYTRSAFDFIRMILSELLFYPILISDIFEMITGETYFFNNAVDGISFVLFALSLASQLFFVYIVRLAILIAANCHSQKLRVPDKDIRDKCDFDPSISNSARYFQCYFVFHVFTQMVAQILIFITIAGAIREENKHLLETDNGNGQG